MSFSLPLQSRIATSLAEFLQIAQPKSSGDIAALLALVVTTAAAVYKPWDRPDPYHDVWFTRPQLKDGSVRERVKETRNIAGKMEKTGKDVVVFWGSQSGTAEGFAFRLARELRSRLGLEAMAADLSDYEPDTISLIPQTKLAVFIMSTYGEGDPSDNATEFWEFVHKEDRHSLKNLRYAAFGLGNSNYQHYNRVIDVVTNALDEVGAKPLLGVGRADDVEGATEEHFMEWKDVLLDTLRETLGLEESSRPYEPQLEVVEDESLDLIDLYLGTPLPTKNTARGVTTSAAFNLPVRGARELYMNSTTSCIHAEVDLSEFPELHYKTGDYLAVYPVNPDEEVDRLLSVLGVANKQDTPISVKSLDPAVTVHVPTPTTAAALFRHYLDICAPVSRDTISTLLQHVSLPSVRSLLEPLAKNKEAYSSFLDRNHVTLGRLLEITQGEEKAWVSLPLSYVIESLAPLQPRLYSISSSSVISPRRPTITARVVSTPLVEDAATCIPGLTSTYLQRRTLGDASDGPATLTACIRSSPHLRPPPTKVPLIMIAAGSGIAPFRAFVLERARVHFMNSAAALGRTVLFFGCRAPDSEFPYREELLHALQTLPDGELVPAYSRSNVAEKKYVQDAVRERGDEVAEMLLERGARVFVCGRAAMARDAAVVVREAVARRKGWSEDETAKWWEGWRRSRGWVEDVWD